MKHQQVSVDYWAMGKAMVIYGALTCLVWLMLRLFNAMFMLPRRLRDKQANLENTLKELQRRYPDLNITEEDLKNAEKEYEEMAKDMDLDKMVPEIKDKIEKPGESESRVTENTDKPDESKKTI